MEEQNWGENCPGDNFAYIDDNPNLNWNPMNGTSLISNLNMTQQSEFTEDVEKIMKIKSEFQNYLTDVFLENDDLNDKNFLDHKKKIEDGLVSIHALMKSFDDQQKKVIDSALTRFGENLKALENETYFSAGGSYFVPGKFSSLNQFIAEPSFEQIASVAASCGNCRNTFNISGGGSVERINGEWNYIEGTLHSFHNIKEAISAHKDLIYEYKTI